MRREYFLVLPLLILAGCRLSDERTTVLHAPGVGCADCARRVVAALAKAGDVGMKDGTADEQKKTLSAEWNRPQKNVTAAVSKVVVHWDTGDIEIRYDSMKLGRKNLEFAIMELGYDVKTEPVDLIADDSAKASLPEACRSHRSLQTPQP